MIKYFFFCFSLFAKKKVASLSGLVRKVRKSPISYGYVLIKKNNHNIPKCPETVWHCESYLFARVNVALR